MKIYYSQLQQHLHQGLNPAYFISGSEHFLIDKAVASIEKKAIQAGFEKSSVIYTDTTSWDKQLIQELTVADMFVKRRLVNLCIQSKLNKFINDSLTNIFNKISLSSLQDVIFITRYYQTLGTAPNWLKPIAKQLIEVQSYPLMPSQLPGFVREINQSLGLTMDYQSVALLLAYTEGNLHAVEQELTKLSLVFGKQPIDATVLAEALRPDQRFTLFDLSHAILAKETAKSVYILRYLVREGEFKTLILWALMQDITQAWRLICARDRKLNTEQTGIVNLWPKKLKQLETYIRGLKLAYLYRAVQFAYQIDLILKGADPLHDADYQLERLVVYLTRF